MKTTDGHEATKGDTYYLEDGQEIMLNSCATDTDGKQCYLVTPFYYGETMQVSGAGGSHHEYSMDYDHEGNETLVYSIFCKAPTIKLEILYSEKLKRVESLSLTCGVLTSEKNLLERREKAARKGFEDAVGIFETAKLQMIQAETDLVDYEDKISDKRQKLSELEDSITGLKSEDVSSLISKTELQRLNKIDFKMSCFEAGGVDNWEWYDESLKDYRARYPEG